MKWSSFQHKMYLCSENERIFPSFSATKIMVRLMLTVSPLVAQQDQTQTDFYLVEEYQTLMDSILVAQLDQRLRGFFLAAEEKWQMSFSSLVVRVGEKQVKGLLVDRTQARPSETEKNTSLSGLWTGTRTNEMPVSGDPVLQEAQIRVSQGVLRSDHWYIVIIFKAEMIIFLWRFHCLVQSFSG